ncbi:hypothetical protein [Gordonibacter massiliensis (ex Traore et al. 2017)]|uniref:Uncharacterized protein n=1 Tax=Gordonibacter massiliensis (ex Traore et al. 2017) TaxID=1841863 RepID=A0A842JLV6_9ACTN|nr:hypothetical protein [Gordonibacter massiliensis (ex Traore et al. 2017)]MBC2890695.1 hypothetical protein [Gordonibacter massiliensis (ex Traore et al. 2017)]
MEKMPPLAKVFEAWSALADGRVSLDAEERRATVASSNGAKAYTVAWSEDGSTYSSNDNATYWQGYAGYPVIAVLMLQGRLPLDRAAADEFAHVGWTELNERFRRDYAAAVRVVVEERGLDATQVEAAAHEAYAALGALEIAIKRGSARPPKSQKPQDGAPARQGS